MPAEREVPSVTEVPAGAERAGGAELGGGGWPGRPAANEGLGIFGGVATTEATDDPPARSFDRPVRVIPVGGAWNQPPGHPDPADEPAEEAKPAPFGGMIRSILYGGDAGDGEPRVTLRDLPPDVQVRFWRLRLIIMAVVGVVFGALTQSWEIGLTLAILAGIVDTVYRSRKAAHYQVASPHPGARKRTRGQLARMPREGYFTLNDRPIPGTSEVIDHLVVGPTGVYAIDSEKWDAKLPVRTQNHMKMYLGPQSQKDRLDHAAWEAAQASGILSEALGTEIAVRPALAIYGPQIPWDIATIRNVDVFTGSALRKYLKRRGRTRGGAAQLSREPGVKLTREEVRTIYEAAQRVLPAPTDAAGTDATSMGTPVAR
jgi:Nuclease-related domain